MSEQKTQREIAADITAALIAQMGGGFSSELLPSAAERVAQAYKTIYAAVLNPSGD